MIRADERELETQTRQKYLRIHEKEVKLFTDNFAVLASTSTFLSGLGFGALRAIAAASRLPGVFTL